jgi:hypothetical protein
LRAVKYSFHDIAGGNVGHRFSNVLGRGIANHTNTAMAVSQPTSKTLPVDFKLTWGAGGLEKRCRVRDLNP